MDVTEVGAPTGGLPFGLPLRRTRRPETKVVVAVFRVVTGSPECGACGSPILPGETMTVVKGAGDWDRVRLTVGLCHRCG